MDQEKINLQQETPATEAETKDSLWTRASTRFNAWISKRVEADPRLNRNTLAAAVGFVGGAALYLAAPAAANQIMETIQTHGQNFLEPGIDQSSIGEFVTVGLMGAAVSGSLHARRAAQAQQAPGQAEAV